MKDPRYKSWSELAEYAKESTWKDVAKILAAMLGFSLFIIGVMFAVFLSL